MARKEVCDHDAFEPSVAFHRIGGCWDGTIDEGHIAQFCKDNKVECSLEDATYLIAQYDEKNKGKLNFFEFCWLVLSATNATLRGMALARDYNKNVPQSRFLSNSLEKALAMVFSNELEYQQKVNEIKHKLKKRKDFSRNALFKLMDYTEPSKVVSRKEIKSFVKKHVRKLTEADLDAIIRRCDTDGDQVLSDFEFINAVSLPKPVRTISYLEEKIIKAQSDDGTYTHPGCQDTWKITPGRTNLYDERERNNTGQQQRYGTIREHKHNQKSKKDRKKSQKKRRKGNKENEKAKGGKEDLKKEGTPSKQVSFGTEANRINEQYQNDKVSQENEYENKSNKFYGLDSHNQEPQRSPQQTSHVIVEEVKHCSPHFACSPHSPCLPHVTCSPSVVCSPPPHCSYSQVYSAAKHHSVSSGCYSTQASPCLLKLSSSVSLEEYNLVDALKALLAFENELEEAKQVLAYHSNFTLNDALNIFDFSKHKQISVLDVKDVFSMHDIHITLEEARCLLTKFDKDGDGYLNPKELSSLFLPKHLTAADLLEERSKRYPNGYYHSNGIADPLTSGDFRHVLGLNLKVANHAEFVWIKYSRRPLAGKDNPFEMLNKDRDIQEAKDNFEALMAEHGFVPTKHELDVIVECFDKCF